MQVQALSWEDLLEKGMATHSSILAWKTPWMEKPVFYSFLYLGGCEGGPTFRWKFNLSLFLFFTALRFSPGLGGAVAVVGV